MKKNISEFMDKTVRVNKIASKKPLKNLALGVNFKLTHVQN